MFIKTLVAATAITISSVTAAAPLPFKKEIPISVDSGGSVHIRINDIFRNDYGPQAITTMIYKSPNGATILERDLNFICGPRPQTYTMTYFERERRYTDGRLTVNEFLGYQSSTTDVFGPEGPRPVGATPEIVNYYVAIAKWVCLNTDFSRGSIR